MQIINTILVTTALLASTVSATTGAMTYYSPNVGYGACGVIHADSELVVAIPTSYWTASNPNNDPLCSETVTITYGGKSVTAKITDKYPTTGSTAIDVSPAVFEEFAALTAGNLQVTWTIG